MATYTFEDIVDLLGPVSEWPAGYLAMYKKHKYDYKDRFCLCVFNFVNGFNNRSFMDFCLANKKLEDRKAYDHIVHLTEILEQRQENLSKWFSYCILDRRWTYLNGQPKYYNRNAL